MRSVRHVLVLAWALWIPYDGKWNVMSPTFPTKAACEFEIARTRELFRQGIAERQRVGDPMPAEVAAHWPMFTGALDGMACKPAAKK